MKRLRDGGCAGGGTVTDNDSELLSESEINESQQHVLRNERIFKNRIDRITRLNKSTLV